MCMFVCGYMHIDAIGAPGAGAKDGCEPPEVSSGNQTWDGGATNAPIC